jgi:hypothetical protein
VRSHRFIANALSLRWVGRRKREPRHGRPGTEFLHFDLQITSKIEKVDSVRNRVRGLVSVSRSSPWRWPWCCDREGVRPEGRFRGAH